MKEFLKKITPEFILLRRRKYIQDKIVKERHKLKLNIISYLESISENDRNNEQQEVLDYLKQNPFSVFPYSFTQNYYSEDIVVLFDDLLNMHYVWQDNKRLYFKKELNKKQTQEYYNGLLIEQDTNSPHQYETSGFHVSEGDVVVDVGAAEGNFTLAVVERAKKIYLFEVEEEWIEALNATFAPWKDKVVIVNKYVSDNDDNNCVTLDKFFGEEKIDFIKADIEGAEPQLLAGAKKILSRQAPMKVVLCTYHRHNDAEMLNQILIENGFYTEFSKGYMIFLYDECISPPYLRRGLICGTKL